VDGVGRYDGRAGVRVAGGCDEAGDGVSGDADGSGVASHRDQPGYGDALQVDAAGAAGDRERPLDGVGAAAGRRGAEADRTGGRAQGGVTAIVLYRKRRWVLRQNGAAYVIRELASDWDRQDEKAFLDSAGRYFARVIAVPGPSRLGRSWDWPLGPDAQQWDGKVGELALAFQALRFADDPRSPNGILVWAPWAVAVAFGMRISAADRDLVLDVWQRPSHGRAGDVAAVIGAQRPHRFGYSEPAPLTELLPGSPPLELTWPAVLAATRRAGEQPPIGRRRRVAVLLVRLGHQGWGPVPEAGTGLEAPHGLRLKVSDFVGVSPTRPSRITVHELRCLPSPGEQFPWQAIPSLVAAVIDWTERKAAELADHTLLFGAIMPPEVALGLGISAGRAERTRWPRNMWPLVYQTATSSLVVPHLNLGSAELRAP